MSTTRGIIPADYDNDDAAHFAVGYLSSAIKGFLDGHHDVDLLRSSYEKLTAALDERDRRRPVLAVPTEWRRGDPEPPQGINILRDPVAEGEAFLCRLEDGTWEWFSDPDDRTGVRVSQSWDQAMQEADGPVYPVPAVSEQVLEGPAECFDRDCEDYYGADGEEITDKATCSHIHEVPAEEATPDA